MVKKCELNHAGTELILRCVLFTLVLEIISHIKKVESCLKTLNFLIYLRVTLYLPNIFSGIWYGKEEHCDCGTGCAECYGKINCGCPDCYSPSTRTVKLNKATKKILKFDSAPTFPSLNTTLLYETAVVNHEESKAREKAVVVEVVVEVGDVVLRRSHKSVDYKRRPMSLAETQSNFRRHRLSMPDVPKFELKQRDPQPKSRVREEYKTRDVDPPKQTRYFCKTCNVNVCNVCVSSSCGAHNVQFLGSGYFHCQSSKHKIQHEFAP